MLISEMIAQLEAAKNEHGDLVIRKTSCHNQPCWLSPSTKVFTFSETMDQDFIHSDDAEIEVGDKFVWL